MPELKISDLQINFKQKDLLVRYLVYRGIFKSLKRLK